MAEFDPDAFLKGPAPEAPAFDPDAFLAQPKSGGAFAAKELTPEQNVRYAALQKLLVKPYGAEDQAVDAYTMGMPRVLNGLTTMVEGKAKDLFGAGQNASAGDYYRGGYGAQDEYFKRSADEMGTKGKIAGLVGSLASGSRGLGMMGKGEQALQAFGQGAVQGAATHGEDWGSAAKGAVKEGILNAGSNWLFNGLLDRFGRVAGARKDLATASRQGSAQSVENNAGVIYDRLDNAGIHFAPKETASLAPNVAARLSKEGFNPNMHSELIPALGEIGGATGQPTTWKQLQNIKTQISDLKGSDDPRMRRIAGALDDEVEKWLHTAKPTMPASSVSAGVNPTADLAEAKSLWSKGSRAATVEAENAVGTRLAADPTRKVQENFEHYTDQFVKDRNKFNPFAAHPEQGKIMDQIVAGSPNKQAAASLASKGAKVLGSIGLGAGATAVAAPLLGYDTGDKGWGTAIAGLGSAAALGLGSRAFRGAAARDQSQLFDTLMRNIVTGSSKVDPAAYVPRNALATIINKQNLAQGMSNYVSSLDNGMPQP